MPSAEFIRGIEIDKPVDHCAVVGVKSFSGRDVASDVKWSLHAQQNRGEDGCGIATLDSYGGTFNHYKDAGRVARVFPDNLRLKELGLTGSVAVGHDRYATSGSKESDLEDKSKCLGPYVVSHERRSLALVHNGNIPKDHLKQLIAELPPNIPLQSDTDSEVIAWRLLHAQGNSWREKIVNGLSGVVGAYSLVIATDEGDLFGVKDPRGIRPLAVAKTHDGVAIVSETAGFRYMKGIRKEREVHNGELVHIDKNGKIRSDQIFPQVNTARCVVESIYFKNPYSMEGGLEVRDVRMRMGKILAQEFQAPEDGIIVGVPESGLEIAEGISLI